MSLPGIGFKLGKADPDILYKAGSSLSLHVPMTYWEYWGLQLFFGFVGWWMRADPWVISQQELALDTPLEAAEYFILNSTVLKLRLCVCVGKPQDTQKVDGEELSKKKGLRSKQEDW